MEKRKLGKSGLEFAPHRLRRQRVRLDGRRGDLAQAARRLRRCRLHLRRHRRRLFALGAGQQGRRIGDDHRQLAEEGPGKRDKVLIATKCGMEMPAEGGAEARPHQEVGRRVAEAAQHRPHRPLPVAQGRQGDAAGGDAVDLRRAGQGGQARASSAPRTTRRRASPRPPRSPRTRACRATRACSRTTI